MKTGLHWKSVGLAMALCGVSPAPATGLPLPSDDEHALEPSGPSPAGSPRWETYISPTAIVATADGKWVFIACATAGQVAAFDATVGRVAWRLPVPDSPQGLALSKDGSRLFVACAAPQSTICVLDTARRKIVRRLPAGHTAMAPVLSPDEKTLYVCNRFTDDVSVIDLISGRALKRVPVEREPVAAALTPDGKCLVVANHLHAKSANRLHIAAAVSIIDTASLSVRKNIPLALGASFLKGVAVSPNGRFAAVTHVRSTYWLTTSGVELGHMNANALSVLDLERLEVLGMVFLDQTTRGGANPWGVVWTPDGGTIVVAHAGAHDLSLVDAPLSADPASFSNARLSAYTPTEMGMAPVPRQRPVRMRQRLALPGKGPRALALAGSRLYVANYFSDSLCRVDLSAANLKAERLSLGAVREPAGERLGEMWFNDAQLCFQGWQSCASCHDSDGRMDALNWDLLNDGVANPKNTRNLLWAHQAGPAMALGVRTNAEAAVRAGIHHILFTDQPEEVPAAIDRFLKSLRPVPSPHLVKGKLSAAALRGRNPYLHDGSAMTLREVLTTRNHDDRHGRTAQLTPAEIDDLTEYLLSL